MRASVCDYARVGSGGGGVGGFALHIEPRESFSKTELSFDSLKLNETERNYSQNSLFRLFLALGIEFFEGLFDRLDQRRHLVRQVLYLLYIHIYTEIYIHIYIYTDTYIYT